VFAASNVDVKILYADATSRCPTERPNFWDRVPGRTRACQSRQPMARSVHRSLRPEHPAVLNGTGRRRVAAAHSCPCWWSPPGRRFSGLKSGSSTGGDSRTGSGTQELHIRDALPFASWDAIQSTRALRPTHPLRCAAKAVVAGACCCRRRCSRPRSIKGTGSENRSLPRNSGASTSCLRQADLSDLKKALVESTSEGCAITGVPVRKLGHPDPGAIHGGCGRPEAAVSS